jgi:AraC family transcriptional regulator
MTSDNATERPDRLAANGADIVNVKSDEPIAPSRRPPFGLQTWRLRRVEKYIRNHISDSINLTELANAAGLTRMYFASQFRARTGIRPHEYVVRQRLAWAQVLLMTPQTKVADVGVCVGFANQAHFTTVFRRYVGLPPHRWRLAQDAGVRVSAVKSRQSRAITPLFELHYPPGEQRQLLDEHVAGG